MPSSAARKSKRRSTYQPPPLPPYKLHLTKPHTPCHLSRPSRFDVPRRPPPSYPPVAPVPKGFDPVVHEKFVRVLFSPDPGLLDIAAKVEEFTHSQVAAWIETPEVQSLITSLTKLFTLRAQVLAHSQLSHAID